jgi:addiction module RelE/StbE family toxin
VKVEWTRKARTDLDEIFDYILLENPQAAVDVLERIEQSTALLADHPGTRELIIPGIPYILPYLTGTKAITIVRVIHSSMQWPGSFSDTTNGSKR